MKATVSATRTGYIGAVAMDAGGKTSYTDSDYAYKTYFLIAGASSNAAFSLATGASTGGTTWVDAVHQVETATCAGTALGDLTTTVTAAGLTGSPLAIPVAVDSGDTAAVWAVKVRAALEANAAVAAMFEIGGATTAIILTRRAKASYIVGPDTYDVSYTNDATLNVALENAAVGGITEDTTSTNTTAAVEAVGSVVWNNDIDFEGRALPSPSAIYALGIEHSTLDVDGQILNYTIGSEYTGRTETTTARDSNVFLSYPHSASILDTLTMTATAGTGLTVVTVIGKE